MGEAIIRPARDDDLEIIKQVAVEAWEPIYQSLRELTGDEMFATVYGGWRTEKADQIASHYRSYPECTLVTEYNGQVVGFITYNLFERKKSGIIGNNAVHPDYRSRGIGKEIVNAVFEHLESIGCRLLRVTTMTHDTPAQKIYKRLGFKEFARSIHYSMEVPSGEKNSD